MDTTLIGQTVAGQMERIDEESPEGSEVGHVLCIVQVRHPDGDAAVRIASTCDYPFEVLGLLQMAQLIAVRP